MVPVDRGVQDSLEGPVGVLGPNPNLFNRERGGILGTMPVIK